MLGSRVGTLRVLFGLSAVLASTVAQEVPAARYPGKAVEAPQLQMQAMPPGYAEAQQDAAWQLSPLTAEERTRAHTRALPQKGVRRSVPAAAFGNAVVTRLPDGRRAWRTRIASPGAQALRVHFRNFAGAGGQLWAYGDRAQVEGPFSGAGPFGDGDFWTASIASDTVTVEYVEAAPNAAPQFPPFAIDSVVHLWDEPSAVERAQQLTARPASAAERPRPEAKASAGGAQVAACHLDVSCYPNVLNYASAIAQLSFVGDDGSSYVCSGSMIKTRDPNKFTPYLLTAHHCISSASEAKSLVARFQYQTPSCGATPPSIYSVPYVLGSTYLAGAPIGQGDYSLVLLKGAPPAGTYFLGWKTSSSALAMGGSAIGIHHPAGSWKRVSFGTRAEDETVKVDGELAPASLYYEVSWNQGKTEGGSSGSPLITQTGEILGTLTYGPMISPGSTVCDIDPEVSGYGRFSNAYPAIQAFLEDAPPPPVNVAPSTLSFAVTDGQLTGAAAQTLTITNSSATAAPFSLTASDSWIKFSAASGTVSSGSPAAVSVTIDPSALPMASGATGTITLSSGTMTPIEVNVQVAISASQSKVEITVAPNPVYAQLPDQDGYAWFYTITVTEKAGVASTLTSFKISGTDYSAAIPTWFGSNQLPANGKLSAKVRAKNLNVPLTRLYEIGGVDAGTARPWTAQVSVSFLARPEGAIVSLDSDPAVIREDPTLTECPWYQQLLLQETGGLNVTLTSFKAGDIDLSAEMREYWGEVTLPASGTLLGGICWSGIQAPESITVEIGGTDSKGHPITVQTSGSFTGPAAQPTAMSASVDAVLFSANAGYTTAPSSAFDLSLGSSTAAWTGRLVFASTAQSDWLAVEPLSGTGATTLRLTAARGKAAGRYDAMLVLTSVDAVPALINIPIRLSVGTPTTDIAEMTTPAPQSTLTGADATFTWTEATGAIEYALFIGTAVGRNDLASVGAGGGSASVTGLPTDGRTLYVRLWTHLPSAWRYNDYVYTASASSGSSLYAEMTSPAPGSTLAGANVTFAWTTAPGAFGYVLFIGSAVGKNDLAALLSLGSSIGVSGLPTDGSKVYVRLYTNVIAGWLYKDYVYTAASGGAGSAWAQMISPAPGSRLAGSNVTFRWTAAPAGLAYALYLGTAAGLNDVASINARSSLSWGVAGLPTDGRRLYARLWTYLVDGWHYTDYEYLTGQ